MPSTYTSNQKSYYEKNRAQLKERMREYTRAWLLRKKLCDLDESKPTFYRQRARRAKQTKDDKEEKPNHDKAAVDNIVVSFDF